MAGKLYVVATPIGNLGDLSPRAQQTLSQVDFIAAEDTRVGARLLSAFGIKKPQVSYFEHNRKAKGEQIARRLEEGESCALITDAGTPAISDPGCDLVELCARRGIEVVAVPGPCAAIAALSIGGLPCGRWCFEGFLSVNRKSRRQHLEQIRGETRTMVFYEAPHKLLRTLEDFYETLGDRPIVLARELTKVHEEARRTTLSQAVDYYRQNPPRGEFVLLLAGAPEGQKEPPEDPMDLVSRLLGQGLSLSQAAKEAARQLNLPKNSIYSQALETFQPEDAEDTAKKDSQQ